MRTSVVLGALLIVAGGAAAGFGATQGKPGTDQTPAFDRVLAAVDAEFKTAQAGLEARAQTLAGSPSLRNSIALDEATVTDQAGRELNVEPGKKEEVLEIGQRVGGKANSLLRRPQGASTSPFLGQPGFHIGLVDGRLLATQVVEVEPTQRPDGAPPDLAGVIAVSWRLDLTVQGDAAAAAKVPARLETPAGGLVLGTDPGSAPNLTRALPSFPTVKVAAIVAKTPPQDLTWMLAVGGGAAALGLLLLVIGLTKRAPQPTVGGLATAMESAAPTSAFTPPPGGTRPTGVASISPEDGGGQVLGRYQLMRQLGAGGMAEVYLARAMGEAGFAKQVALKLLHPHLTGTQVAVDHFLDEARLASNLSHPNIVQVVDLGKVEQTYFIAMEYVEGTDLERVLMTAREAGRQVPLGVAMTILRRVCDGLDFAHKATNPEGVPLGLVHRDVKSANVMLSKQGQVKVGDFGIAKATTQVHTTQIGETKGTPSKMAPEQRMGNPVDRRADVYSVAAIGYELFTGVLVNLDLAHALHKGFEGWPHLPAPSSVRTDLPPELDALLIGALAFDPAQRPDSCHDLEESLAAVATRHNLVADDKAIARWLAGELKSNRADSTPVAVDDTRMA